MAIESLKHDEWNESSNDESINAEIWRNGWNGRSWWWTVKLVKLNIPSKAWRSLLNTKSEALTRLN